MPDLNTDLQKQHLRRILLYQQQVEQVYGDAIERIFQAATGLQPVSDVFRISDYPNLQRALERELVIMVRNLETVIVNGIMQEWHYAGENLVKVLELRFGKNLPEAILKSVRDTRQDALQAFIKRKSGKLGLDLSQRVFKYVKQFRKDLEQGLMLGISEGRAATAMAREMKQYLRHPDKLFRRVRDAKGKLRLSTAAKDFHPGQGVYRSSFKNALRMTAQETNNAYRNSDQVRWAESRFVLGYEVKLSDAHPRFDICDSLKGQYGKEFVWNGWHVQCICYAVPILPTEEEFRAYERAILEGRERYFRFKGVVKGVPPGFENWIAENTDLMQNWVKKPEWVRRNKKFTSDLK